MSGPVIYRRVNRPDPALIAAAAECAMADLHEALGPVAGRMGLMSPRMRPLLPGKRIAGPAVTAFCAPADNLMMHQALYLAEPGDVLVVTVRGEDCGAQWGDTAAAYAKNKGLAGIVVEGGIRDIDGLRALESPVWSTAISPAHPDKAGAGVVNAPIVCDGVQVRPGDVIVADGDGVLVIPKERLAEVVETAQKRLRNEDEAARKIAAGAHPFEMMQLDKTIEKLAIPVHDAAWDD